MDSLKLNIKIGQIPVDIRDDYPIQWASTGLEAVIIPLKSREALAKVKMDRDALEGYIQRHPKNYCNHLFFVDMGNKMLAARCMMEDFVEVGGNCYIVASGWWD